MTGNKLDRVLIMAFYFFHGLVEAHLLGWPVLMALEWKELGLLYRAELQEAHIPGLHRCLSTLALKSFPGHLRD